MNWKFWQKTGFDLPPGKTDEAVSNPTLDSVQPQFTTYCFGSQFAMGGGASPIQYRRYIEADLEGWRYVELETRPNTQIEDDLDSHFKPVTSYTVLAENLSFGMAIQKLHEFEVGNQTLKNQTENDTESRFPPHLQYRNAALREGLLFDTQHRLHGSKDGRPVLFHADARFLDSDIATLAKLHYEPDENDLLRLIEATSSMQALEKMIEFRLGQEELHSAASTFNYMIGDDMRPLVHWPSCRLEYGLQVAEAIKNQAHKESSPSVCDEMNRSAQLIEWLPHVFFVRKGIDNQDDGKIDAAQHEKMTALFKAWQDNPIFTPELKEYFTRIVLYTDVAQETHQYLKGIAKKWIANITDPATGLKQMFLTQDENGSYVKMFPPAENPAFTAFHDNTASMLRPLDLTIELMSGRENGLRNSARVAENVSKYIYYKKGKDASLQSFP